MTFMLLERAYQKIFVDFFTVQPFPIMYLSCLVGLTFRFGTETPALRGGSIRDKRIPEKGY